MKRLPFTIVVAMLCACTQKEPAPPTPATVQAPAPAASTPPASAKALMVARQWTPKIINGISANDRAELSSDFMMFSMECHTFMNRVLVKQSHDPSMRKVTWDELAKSGAATVASYADSYRQQAQKLAFAPGALEQLKRVRAVELTCGSAFSNNVRFHGLSPSAGAETFDSAFTAAQNGLHAELDALPVLTDGNSLGLVSKLTLDSRAKQDKSSATD